MKPKELIENLWRLGWLQGYANLDAVLAHLTDVELAVALTAYQAFHGLRPTGVPDAELFRYMEEPRCGLPDVMPLQERLCRWGHKEITWTVTGAVPGIEKDAQVQACAEAFRYWAEVADLRPRYVNDASRANIIMTSGAIDGPSGTLAWSELPCGGQRQLTQKYDTRETWIVSANPTSGIDLVRVVCHELGHALGMPHIGPGNLLAPTYSRQVRKPQRGDIDEMQTRYGPPVVVPPTFPPTIPPTPTPGDPGGGFMDIVKFLATMMKMWTAIQPILPYLPEIWKALEELLRSRGQVQAADAVAQGMVEYLKQP